MIAEIASLLYGVGEESHMCMVRQERFSIKWQVMPLAHTRSVGIVRTLSEMQDRCQGCRGPPFKFPIKMKPQIPDAYGRTAICPGTWRSVSLLG